MNTEEQEHIKKEAKEKYGQHYDFFKKAGDEINNIIGFNSAYKQEDILIVGSGASLCAKEQGDLIDVFDNVCRIDSFVHPEGNEEYLGSKTTHIIYSGNPLLPPWAKSREYPSVKNKILLLPPSQFISMQAWAYYFAEKNGYLFDSVQAMKIILLERLGMEFDDQDIWKSMSSKDLYDTKNNWTIAPQYISNEIAERTVEYPSAEISTISYFKDVLNYKVHTIGMDFDNSHVCEHLTSYDKGPLHELIELDKETILFDEWVDRGEVFSYS